jgi:Sulfatase-modifying factor enzyme 1
VACGWWRSDPPRPDGHPSWEGIFSGMDLQWDRSHLLTIDPMPQLSIAKHPQKIHYFEEPLHRSPQFLVKPINMVLIQGGTFDMGSPETEIDRSANESPQHQVTVPSFFMSEYPIVQCQWLVVADSMSQVETSLANNSSRLPLKGENRNVHPVRYDYTFSLW